MGASKRILMNTSNIGEDAKVNVGESSFENMHWPSDEREDSDDQ